jgi:hypothetical protein
METVVLKALCDVNGFNTRSFFEASNIQDEFVSTARVDVGI